MRKFLLVLSSVVLLSGHAEELKGPPVGSTATPVVLGTLKNDALKLALSPDGSRLAALDQSGSITIFDTKSGKTLKTIEGEGECHSIEFGSNEKMLITAGPGNDVVVWNAETGAQEKKFAGSAGNVCAATLSPDGTRIAGTDMEGKMHLWDFETGKILQEFKPSRAKEDPEKPYSEGLAFSPDGRFLVTEANDAKARVWDAVRGVELFIVPDHDGFTASVSISPGGATVATTRGVGGFLLRLWRLDNGEVVRVFTGHENYLTCSAFSPDGSTILTASQDKTIRQWDVDSGLELRRFTLDVQVNSIAYGSDGRTFYSLGEDKKLLSWSLREAPPLENDIALHPLTLETAWSRLGSIDYEPRSEAVLAFLHHPDQPAALKYLMDRIGGTKTEAAVTDKQRALIAKLNDPQFTARDDAFNALKEMKHAARASLIEALESSTSSETKHHLRMLLKLIGGTDDTRVVLALEILSIMHTPEAKAALETLAAKENPTGSRAKTILARAWRNKE